MQIWIGGARGVTCALVKKGHTATSGWTRAELYSRPFRVIQFDTIDCSKLGDGGILAAAEHGMNHVLTSICCFSRFVWLIPIPDSTAETIGKALLENVLLGMGMFPSVLRSDRALAFTGSVLAYINQQLEIKHVLGSSYHPQSQGMVERMHRTLKIIGRAVVQENPNNWPAMMPYAQCVLRVIPPQVRGWSVTLRSGDGTPAQAPECTPDEVPGPGDLRGHVRRKVGGIP